MIQFPKYLEQHFWAMLRESPLNYCVSWLLFYCVALRNLLSNAYLAIQPCSVISKKSTFFSLIKSGTNMGTCENATVGLKCSSKVVTLIGVGMLKYN